MGGGERNGGKLHTHKSFFFKISASITLTYIFNIKIANDINVGFGFEIGLESFYVKVVKAGGGGVRGDVRHPVYSRKERRGRVNWSP